MLVSNEAVTANLIQFYIQVIRLKMGNLLYSPSCGLVSGVLLWARAGKPKVFMRYGKELPGLGEKY